MPQQQCPWCHKCGPRYEEGEAERPGPHDDGSACVCRHVNAASAVSAVRNHGRFWTGTRWLCMAGCAPAEEVERYYRTGT